MTIAFAMLAGVLIFIIGVRVGMTQRAALKPSYRCGCTHHLATHDPKTGKCMAAVRDPDTGAQLGGCACQQYIGDRPPPSYDELIKGGGTDG